MNASKMPGFSCSDVQKCFKPRHGPIHPNSKLESENHRGSQLAPSTSSFGDTWIHVAHWKVGAYVSSLTTRCFPPFDGINKGLLDYSWTHDFGEMGEENVSVTISFAHEGAGS
jgi:hypothetical protein